MNTPDQIIRDAERIKAFVEDDAVSGAMSRLERRYYEQFKSADSSEQRVKAWACATVLDHFLLELRVTISAGEAEVLNAAQKAAKPTRS